ncbi:hypothetical protein [Nannocystis punicea]|uniref:Uncharacterized protein n=1 Tax=Nannocystis punicea TaxID=2995304 RepID=A0ABY7GYP0_9BACT|nr:hypothetical protein [Nannocystis poenicansa]WAS92005.1 hypothetical protein O0S08_37970 [Nannocystis poenicansa]
MSSGTSQAPLRRDTQMWTNYFGVGGAVRWGRREVETASEDDVETTVTGLGGVQGRLAGFASAKPRFGRGLRFLTPELFLALEVGGTRRAGEGQPSRAGGFAVGAEGVVRIGVGRALASRVSPYGKVQLDQRFAVHLRDSAEGNHYLAALRGSAGLLVRTRPESFAVLAGAALDGVVGAQKLGSRSAVAQLTAGAELAIYAHPRRHLALAWVGDVRTTIAGRQFGGGRLDGRVTFDVMIGRSAGPKQIGYVSLFAAFTASEIWATPMQSPGEARSGYAASLGVGVGL